MRKLPLLICMLAIVPECSGASLAYSTYLRDGFTPTAMTSDAQGNLYLAGSAVIDPQAQTLSAAVLKLDPKASQYSYLAFLDSASNDQISAITVDSAGNVFVTGSTVNTAFPVTGSGQIGTLPTGSSDPRSFVTKLSSDGLVLFSVLIGGSTPSSASAIALTAQGQILVSGLAAATGFPVTSGAFAVADSNGEWFLIELDPAAVNVLFSATGIGGSSIALDSAGNIYLSGSSTNLDYPTTPGAYQTSFPETYICYGLCQIEFPAVQQHLTKVDPNGANLFYSTGINDLAASAGSTVNTGLAIDSAGNAYVTGTLFEGRYPFTVTVANNYAPSYLTKLDSSGSVNLFSVPVGGSGVALDSSGTLYTAGVLSSTNPTAFATIMPLPITLPTSLSWVPGECVPNGLTGITSSYVMKLDAATGDELDALWIDGADPTAIGITLATGNVWTSGFTPYADVPFTAGSLTTSNFLPGPLPGAFLSAVNFSGSPAPQNGAPVIACVLDAGNLTHAGPVAAYEFLSIFGANLGPVSGSPAPDGTDPSIAGVTVTFDGNPAEMTYVSSSQINVLVPAPAVSPNYALPLTTVMQVSVNGVTLQRELPVTAYNLNVFADLATALDCPGGYLPIQFVPLTLNMDASRNSCANPAQSGSTISVFVHGVGVQQFGSPMPTTVSGIAAQIGQCSATVEDVTLAGLVYKVDLRLPTTLSSCNYGNVSNTVVMLDITLTFNGSAAGPLMLSTYPTVTGPPTSQPLPIWVSN